VIVLAIGNGESGIRHKYGVVNVEDICERKKECQNICKEENVTHNNPDQKYCREGLPPPIPKCSPPQSTKLHLRFKNGENKNKETGILTNGISVCGIEEDVVHGEGSHGLQEGIVRIKP